jgi:hypothetical protein
MAEIALTTQTANRLNNMNLASRQGMLGNRIKDLESGVFVGWKANTITPAATVDALQVAGNLLTTGNALVISAVDATLNGGMYLKFLGGTGATTEFSVGEGGNVVVAGTIDVTGATRRAKDTSIGDATDSVTVTAAYYGKTIILSHADNVTLTLPANGAAVGSWFRVMLNGDDNLAVTMAAASADTLVTKNDNQADSVTFGSGHRIGALVEFWSDGTYWHANNLSSDNTMSVTT